MKQLAAVALVTGCAHAPPVAPSAAAPAPLAFYVGTWKCTATEYNEAGAVAKEWPNLGVVVSPDYASWVRIVVTDSGKQITSELMGIDDKGHYHHVFTDDEGGYGSLTSPGWTGDKLVLDEDHADPANKTRMTLIKIDSTHYKHTAEADTGSGFKLQVEKSCQRA